jgi:hypothetical protein
LPGFDARPNAPVHFPGRSDGGSPIGPKEMLGLGLSGERPDLPAELPGFELPRYEGGFGAESLQLPQPEAIPAPPKGNEEARSSISDRR